MTKDQHEIRCKLQRLRFDKAIGHVAKTCHYFGTGRTSLYRWCKAYAERGEAVLRKTLPIPKIHSNQTAPELEKKVLALAAYFTQGQRVSFGIWGAITASGCLTPQYRASSRVMA